MPSVTDVIKTTLVQELAGVQMSNAFYWRVDDLGADPTLGVALADIMTGYHVAIRAACSPAWSLVCGIYENITAIEGKAVAFTSLAGTGVGDSHPQDQPVRFNKYANSAAPLPVSLRHGASNQSGILETLSTRGRINDLAELDALKNFLRTQQIFGLNWTLTPMLRIRETIGPPATYQYQVVAQAIVNPKLQKLRTRKTKLCGAL